MNLKTEKYASCKYDVLTKNEFPRRVGHIIGAKTSWFAECGPISLGYFKSKKLAVSAINEYLSYYFNNDSWTN